MRIRFIIFLVAVAINSFCVFATDRISTASGNWATAGTWTPSGVPAAGDNITIASGHTITMNGNTGACNNLTINGTASWTAARTTNVSGNLIINNGGVITGTATGVLTVSGIFAVPSGASATVGRITITITGATTIDGSLTLNNVTGTKTFANITVNSGGTWTATAAAAVTINGNVSTNGTFNCNSGTYTVSGNFSANAGTTNFEGSIGGTLTVASGATLNANIGNLSVTGSTTISGTINITTVTGTKNLANITVNAGGIWNSTVAENVTVTGNVVTSGTWECLSGTYTISGNFSANAGTTNFEGSIGGNLTISSGATFDGTTGVLTVAGSTSVSGTLIISTITAAKTFVDVTINSGGVWNCIVAESMTISGNLTNNGTFNSNTGVYTLSGIGKTISGTNPLPISSAAVTGTYTNNGTFTVGTALTGAGTLTQGTNSTLNIGGTSTVTTLNASANTPNLVKYNGAGAQTIKTTTYYNLEVAKTGGSTGTFGGSTTVNNDFTVTSGIAAMGAFTFLVSGSTSVSGTLNITSTTGTKTFNDLTINSGGTWNVSVAEAFTINGNLSNSGTFTSNTGMYTLAGTGKTIFGTLTVNSIAVTGSYTNNATLTSPTALTGVGTFSQGATGILNIGTTVANFSVATFNTSASGNTVNYNLAGVQNVRVPNDGAYHHLTIAGSGIKTLLGATTINGNLSISSTLDVSATNYAINLGGNWSNTGTFTPRAGTVTLNGSGAQTITKAGGEIFNHLTLSGSGTKTLGNAITTNGNLVINSTLNISSSNYGITVKGNWTNSGTFIQQNGTVTFNGAVGQTIGGTTTGNFYNITQSNAAGVTLAQHQNLIGTLTISVGTFTATGFNFTLVSTASGTASIGTIPAGANFAGNISMQRYTGVGPTDWRFLSSAVSGATIAQWAADFATSGFIGSTDPSNSFVSIYTYDETVAGVEANGFVAATNVTNSISNGKGFWVYLGPNPVTYSVTGSPNTFSQSLPVTFTSSAGAANDGWNMVANPYPSAIDWNNASWTKTNVNNAIYIYNSSTGSFASYVGGVGVNGGSQYIASQQAFWVQTSAASSVLTMVENVKAATQNPAYLKTVHTPNTSHYPMAFKDFPIPLNANTTPNSLKLTASGNGFDDETFIQFLQGASANFDGSYDAWKMQNLNTSGPNISSVINDSTDLSINSLPDLNSNATVKIRITVPIAGTYSIRRDSLLMLPMSSCLYLEDLANGNMIDLRTAVSYSFIISDTTKAPRFLLHIFAPISKQAVNQVCYNDSTGIAIAKGTGAGPWNYVWKDAGGNTFKTTTNSSTSDTLFHLATGVYTVQVSGGVCGIVTDTIQIKSTSTFSLASNFSNVSCNGMSDGTAAAVTSGGIIPYTYLWNSGATTSGVNNLSVGNYSVAVTDAAGCSQTQSFLISQPALLVSGFTASTDTVDLSVNNSVTCTNNSLGATTYLWNFGDTTASDTSQNLTHNYSYSGTYIVTLVVSNGTCSDSSKKIIIVVDSLNQNTTAVSQIVNSSSVNIFYDNGTVYLAFDLPEVEDVNISVYNLLGEKIFSEEAYRIRKEKIKLDMPGVSSGIYIAVAQMTDAVISKKFLFRSR